MSNSFRSYIKIRTFLGYPPKDILRELQDAFGDEAPKYSTVQRWSKKFRDSAQSPFGSPTGSQDHFETYNSGSDNQIEQNIDMDDNTNARKSDASICNVGIEKKPLIRSNRPKKLGITE
ncbi:unnamed protein product [Didymodactylos carnosus]|uniref:Mos1 transposase HTH domain-containing protein n=1 Tax=Didymodactylos carnosus TaxID=1234261 RepID=A0A8S2L0Z9_9BILA|nr:unnamed protein product [Didymodactylos carnosus]CAF3874812.1 unnamed protein product [Didymodactylos carnosus]